MNRYITLIRHAKSDWGHPELSDFDRPLNSRGDRDAPLMGKKLAEKLHELNTHFNLILSSQAKRAITTATIIADAVHYPVDQIETEPDIYLASATELLNALHSVSDEIHHVALVSHNPGMTTLTNNLGSQTTLNLPTCGIMIIEVDIQSWKQLTPGCGKTIDFFSPKTI